VIRIDETSLSLLALYDHAQRGDSGGTSAACREFDAEVAAHVAALPVANRNACSLCAYCFGLCLIENVSAYTFFPSLSATMMIIAGSLANSAMAATNFSIFHINLRFLPACSFC
jgi:hypothetical protein